MRVLQKLSNNRLVKFGLVGAMCGVFQIVLLSLLVKAFAIESVTGKTVANTVAFFVSVQFNFVCSYLYTWKDRIVNSQTSALRKLITFNTMMVGSLVANQLVFVIVIHFLPLGISGVIGIVVGAGVNLLVSNKLVFARQIEEQEKMSPKTISIACVLPAYNEAENIEAVVKASLQYLQQAKWVSDYRIIVVNDGSKDATPEIINRLATENSKVIAVHQPNGGYGAAVRRGFVEASGTGMEWVHFMDSDQQFKLEDLELFRPALNTGKTFVAGFRKERADTFDRKIKGWLWTFGCSVVMGRFFPDIDCAFKVIRMDLLGDPQTLKAEGSTVNAEIILRAAERGARFTHIGVNHYPRGGGKSSCEDMHFILQSVQSLLKLRVSHLRHRFSFAQ